MRRTPDGVYATIEVAEPGPSYAVTLWWIVSTLRRTVRLPAAAGTTPFAGGDPAAGLDVAAIANAERRRRLRRRQALDVARWQGFELRERHLGEGTVAVAVDRLLEAGAVDVEVVRFW